MARLALEAFDVQRPAGWIGNEECSVSDGAPALGAERRCYATNDEAWNMSTRLRARSADFGRLWDCAGVNEHGAPSLGAVAPESCSAREHTRKQEHQT